ncbi:hypothetical protein [Bifidobacterium callimiconis]|uniref:hypothetical protein n=1 Tax=Bifidobacterium callimiconis TaxID=2306973 RepID=UPI001F49F19F|nr:hypothetical protein [Bifidobacterium callimiconis]
MASGDFLAERDESRNAGEKRVRSPSAQQRRGRFGQVGPTSIADSGTHDDITVTLDDDPTLNFVD